MATTLTDRLQLAQQDEGDLDWEVDLNAGFVSADARLLKVSSDFSDNPDPNTADPTVVDGDYVGQRYIDETPTGEKRVWICTTVGTPPTGVWELLATESVIASSAINSNTVLQTILEDLDTRITANLASVTADMENVNRPNELLNGEFLLSNRSGFGGNFYDAFGSLNDYAEICAFTDFKRIHDRWVILRELDTGSASARSYTTGGILIHPPTNGGQKLAICQHFDQTRVAQWSRDEGVDETGEKAIKLSMAVSAKIIQNTGSPGDAAYDEHFTLVLLQHTGTGLTDPITTWNADGVEPGWASGWSKLGSLEVTPNVDNETDEFKVLKMEDIEVTGTGAVVAMILCNTKNAINSCDINIQWANLVLGSTIGNSIQAKSKEEERVRCASWFWKSFPESVVPANAPDVWAELGAVQGYDGCISTITNDDPGEVAAIYVQFPVPMAKVPTVTTLNPQWDEAVLDANKWVVDRGNQGSHDVTVDDISQNGVSCKLGDTNANNEYVEGHIVCDAESFGLAQLYVWP